MATDEQRAVDKLDALLSEGVINEGQLNDLENVAMACTGGSGAWRKTGKTAFDSALRAAINDYEESA